MESYPTFHNEVGVPVVRIGCREFKCIGDKPPQDHPHIYLNMGDASEIEPLTMRVWPEAGRLLGLGRNATYDAVARGEIPVIRFGRRIVVSRKALERLVDPDRPGAAR